MKKLILIVCAVFCFGVVHAEKRPNVLCIIVDDLRPELNCFSKSRIQSPNIDRLASEGLTFNRAYCNIPVCGASRASLMTGLRPSRSRFWDYESRADQDAVGVKVLPQLFKENGYTTLSRGKVFHNSADSKAAWDDLWQEPLKNNWRNYQLPGNIALDKSRGNKFGPPFECADVPDGAYADGMLAEKAMDDLKKLKASGEPFFLATGFHKPHLPFNAPKKYWDLYDRKDIKLPENNHAAEDAPKQAYSGFYEMRAYDGIPKTGPVDDEMAVSLIHGYYASVSYVDAQIGKVLDLLKELELDQNTIVLMFGDHGWSLDNHGDWCKHSNYDVALRAPLIVKVPGMPSAGQRTDSLVEFVDLYPTLADLCRLTAPEHLEGKSMRPVLKNPSSDFRDFIVAKWHHGMTLTTDRYAYTEWSQDGDSVDAQMLFDHRNDPDEFINIVNNPEQKQVIKKLKHLLDDNWGSAFFDRKDRWFK
jgi:iduronate 2-sulfatase